MALLENAIAAAVAGIECTQAKIASQLMPWEKCSAVTIGTLKSSSRLESCALPPGWGPRRLPKPGAFTGTDPKLVRVPPKGSLDEAPPDGIGATSFRIWQGHPPRLRARHRDCSFLLALGILVLGYPPQRGEIPATPPHTLKGNALGRASRFRTARKGVTVARRWPEKKGAGERLFAEAS
jgi:hypothetical protein